MAGWSRRCDHEANLVSLYHFEENYWKQRGSVNWILNGDANTIYFQALANGRYRRYTINRLLINGSLSSDPHVVSSHTYEFYSTLISAQPPPGFLFHPLVWLGDQLISDEDNTALMPPFPRRKWMRPFPLLNLLRPWGQMVLHSFLQETLGNT